MIEKLWGRVYDRMLFGSYSQDVAAATAPEAYERWDAALEATEALEAELRAQLWPQADE